MEFVTETSETAENIWIAASDGDIVQVQRFLDEGVPINAQDEYGYSPLHAASSYGHCDLIEFLLQKGADVNIRDPDGDTPLLVVEEPEALGKLLSHGADIHAVNNDGLGIIEKAMEDENEELLAHLLQLPGFLSDPKMIEKMQSYIAAINGQGDNFPVIEEGNEEEGEEDDDAMDDN